MKTNISTSNKILLVIGSLMCVWAVAAVLNALSYMSWSISELVQQYMVASGMVKPLHTMVDFYTHIKGIEYLICLAFFIVFPYFYNFISINKTRVLINN